MNEIIGYVSTVLIGISLGLIGGGGSILTVPVLVYLFNLSPLTATSYSLFIVGSTSFVGAANNWRHKLVHLPTALLFGIASVLTVFAVRRFVVPAIPQYLTTIGGFEITFPLLTMVLFALLMLVASFSMIKNKTLKKDESHHPRAELFLYGIGVGLVTGFLGAGGGFLLIPAMVLILGLEMKMAVGTSLFIIAVNSLAGFTGDAGQHAVDWEFLGLVTAIAVAGIFIGGRLGRRLNGAQLRKGFGWFVLVMAVYILAREVTTHL